MKQTRNLICVQYLSIRVSPVYILQVLRCFANEDLQRNTGAPAGHVCVNAVSDIYYSQILFHKQDI